MNDAVRELFDEFRKDHELLGRGLYEIAVALRAEDDLAAAEAARRLDRAAAAHIAFEEGHFYPELRALIGDLEVDRFGREHKLGLAAIARLCALQPGDRLSCADRAELLGQIETMQTHTEECGEHFGALGRIPEQRQRELLTALKQLRTQSSRWTTLATARNCR